MENIYHITTNKEWEIAKKDGFYVASSLKIIIQEATITKNKETYQDLDMQILLLRKSLVDLKIIEAVVILAVD